MSPAITTAEVNIFRHRIRQLERALSDVRAIATETEEHCLRDTRPAQESPEYHLARTITNRINRTLL